MAIEAVPVVARTPQLIRTFNPPLVGMAIEAVELKIVHLVMSASALQNFQPIPSRDGH
jgi:hypothetical protein